MKTIAIPQFYCGPSGQKGLYNRQEVGLARAFAALGCRAVVLYPAPGAAAPTVENPEPNVKIYYLPVRKLGAQAFFSSWQVLLDEQVDAVHVMGDNSPGVPSLYRFCCKHGILFYSQLGALKSTSGRAAVRAVMDLLLRRALKLDVDAKIFVFVGRLDAYKKPLDLVPLLEAAPDWQAVIIGQGTQGAELARLLAARGLAARCRMIPQLPNESVHVYYHACDAFVNLNDQEIFGMSLLEAMFAGCPPVARHAPGPDLIIEDGLSGWLCSTVPQLAEALGRITPEMGAAAQRRINEHFLWQNSAELALTLLPAKGNRHG